MPSFAGIDEAGRGPIIGPLYICGVSIEEGQEDALKKMGVKDSKLLTPKQREKLYAQLIDMVKYHLIRIPIEEIDDAVEGPDINLNWLEANKAAEIINKLAPDTVVIDCPSPNLKAYTTYVEKLLKSKTKVICAHHADTDYVVVGAASIIAKVSRDKEIEELRKKIGVDFGSGYITDPKTKAFVESYWNKYPEIMRHSWKTFKNVSQQTLGKY